MNQLKIISEQKIDSINIEQLSALDDNDGKRSDENIIISKNKSRISKIDTMDLMQNKIFDGMNNRKNQNIEQSLKNKEENKDDIIGTPDSLLMLLGEMLAYDFGLVDSAANRYKELVSNYPNSKFVQRAMYALTFYSYDSLKWKKEYSNKFSNSKTLLHSNDDSNKKIDKITLRRELILSKLNVNLINTIDSLKVFYNENNDPYTLYFLAYISDYYLNDIDFSKKYYKQFLDSFPNNEHFEIAKIRFEEIQKSILDTVNEVIDSTEINTEIIDSILIKNDSIKKFNSSFDSLSINDKTKNNIKNSEKKLKILKDFNIGIDTSLIKLEKLKQ